MKTVKRFVSILMAVACVCAAMMVPASASEMDVLHDYNPNARYTYVPTSLHDLGEGDYSGSFDIVQFTNTNYYFKPNDDGKIYYGVWGSSEHGRDCTVETWCKDCDTEISSFEFDPNNCPYHRVVTVGSRHLTHGIYFKIIAFRGGEYFSNNDFDGMIKVSWTTTQ